MNDVAQNVLDQLLATMPLADASEDDQAVALVKIELALDAGWLPSEIVHYMSWTEEFNPSADEDVALGRMASIRAGVDERLKIVLRKVLQSETA